MALVLASDEAAAYLAAGVFVIGAATDRLDGYLARRFESHTRTGAWLDPLADKLFVLSPVVALAATGRFPVWAAIVFVARELAVTLLRVRAGARGRSMPASALAKWKTAVQMLAILLYILPLRPVWDGARLGVLVAAVVLTLWSGLAYFAAVEGRQTEGAR